ncbi:hypothetical protein PCH_Pc20g00370 [Penicillium rubens Wisconsin 54-1255]|uniref:Uncharacterized protein n=1 Tax=Penicillium rubens (strain ATCC 28089 / DSM 1075 / NRRL 1951 / Wisconsin 54-1255) TaxID=500485 RepID=B6HFD4_PENRW|nr:hypothetical protein PCH_Pc20g00370 [Penicillium rubens Wisconsin 54-1255]
MTQNLIMILTTLLNNTNVYISVHMVNIPLSVVSLSCPTGLSSIAIYLGNYLGTRGHDNIIWNRRREISPSSRDYDKEVLAGHKPREGGFGVWGFNSYKIHSPREAAKSLHSIFERELPIQHFLRTL